MKSAKIARRISMGALLFVILYVTVLILSLMFYFQVFGWLYGMVASFTSHGYLGQTLTALLLALLFLLPFGKILKSFLPLFPQKNKRRYKALAFILLAILFFVAHLLRGDDNFDRQTGAPLKYYSMHADSSYHVFSSPGFDPETGDTLKPVNQEVVGLYKKQNQQKKEGIDAFIPMRPGIIYNNSTETIFFVVSPGNDKEKLTQVYSVVSNKKISFSLSEGTHYFILLDADGKEIERSISETMETTFGWWEVDINGKTYSDYGMYVIKIDAHKDWMLHITSEEIIFRP